MKRVTGIGGVFFTCANPPRMKTWHRAQFEAGTKYFLPPDEHLSDDTKDAA